MPKEEVSILQLQSYLPEKSFEEVLHYLQYYNVHLTIARKRQSILGDYRLPVAGQAHRISINGNLNAFSFLITLLHELAHLLAYEKFGPHISTHGQEWKNEFGELLAKFLAQKIFPSDIEKALLQTLKNPAATSCADEQLLRILQRYDQKKEGFFLIEQIPAGGLFTIKGQRIFKKGDKVRKRYKCLEIKTGKLYLFSAVYEVQLIANVI